MSVNFNVYLGPYLLVPKVKVTKTVPVMACSANCGGTGALAKSKFCPDCGAPLRQAQVGSERWMHLHCEELDPQFENWFWTPDIGVESDTSIWLPNQRGVGQTFGAEYEFLPEQLKPLAPDFVNESLQAFSNRYSKVLQALLQRFNRAPDLRVGAVPYFC